MSCANLPVSCSNCISNRGGYSAGSQAWRREPRHSPEGTPSGRSADTTRISTWVRTSSSIGNSAILPGSRESEPLTSRISKSRPRPDDSTSHRSGRPCYAAIPLSSCSCAVKGAPGGVGSPSRHDDARSAALWPRESISNFPSPRSENSRPHRRSIAGLDQHR